MRSMSERGGEGCGPIFFGGLSVAAAAIILGAYIRVQQLSPSETGEHKSPTPTAIATAIIRNLAEENGEQSILPAQVLTEITPMSKELVASVIEAHQVGDKFVVVRNDNLRILVKKQKTYLMILTIYNGQDFWADRVLPGDIIYVE